MKTNNPNDLQLRRKGELPLNEAQETVNYVLQEMSQGKKLCCQMYSSGDETVFTFIANGMCATLHLQAFTPQQEGGLV